MARWHDVSRLAFARDELSFFSESARERARRRAPPRPGAPARRASPLACSLAPKLGLVSLTCSLPASRRLPPRGPPRTARRTGWSARRTRRGTPGTARLCRRGVGVDRAGAGHHAHSWYPHAHGLNRRSSRPGRCSTAGTPPPPRAGRGRPAGRLARRRSLSGNGIRGAVRFRSRSRRRRGASRPGDEAPGRRASWKSAEGSPDDVSTSSSRRDREHPSSRRAADATGDVVVRARAVHRGGEIREKWIPAQPHASLRLGHTGPPLNASPGVSPGGPRTPRGASVASRTGTRVPTVGGEREPHRDGRERCDYNTTEGSNCGNNDESRLT